MRDVAWKLSVQRSCHKGCKTGESWHKFLNRSYDAILSAFMISFLERATISPVLYIPFETTALKSALSRQFDIGQHCEFVFRNKLVILTPPLWAIPQISAIPVKWIEFVKLPCCKCWCERGISSRQLKSVLLDFYEPVDLTLTVLVLFLSVRASLWISKVYSQKLERRFFSRDPLEAERHM